MTTTCSPTAHPPSSSTRFTEQMLHRICSEFSEMPGLQLTSRQAQRLWGIDEFTCTQILEVLVGTKFLRRSGSDKYARATEGPVAFPRVRAGRGRPVPVAR